MKIKHLKRYFVAIAVTAFLALLAGNAFADKALNNNPDRDFLKHSTSGGTASNGYSNNYMVVSPYWQVEGGGSYTFVAVSHSSLSGMNSQIGVTVNAITSAQAAYGTAATFTVGAGETKRLFIISTNHSTINSTAQTDAAFIAGTTNFSYGHVRINPQTSHPMLKTQATVLAVTNLGDGFRDSTMLSYWGSVIVEANTTGFAMEFIGDMNDSVTLPHSYMSHFDGDIYMASGVNLN